MSKLEKLKPASNEVVRIKFKTLNEIMKLEAGAVNFHDTEESYSIGSNFKAYMAGGDFVVGNTYEKDDDGEYITVRNHLDKQYDFYVYEEVIDSIEIIQDAERFESFDHKILVVRVEDEMYINGKPIIWNEENERKEHENRLASGREDKPYENKNRRLLKIFENYIADLAVRESFKDMGAQ